MWFRRNEENVYLPTEKLKPDVPNTKLVQVDSTPVLGRLPPEQRTSSRLPDTRTPTHQLRSRNELALKTYCIKKKV